MHVFEVDFIWFGPIQSNINLHHLVAFCKEKDVIFLIVSNCKWGHVVIFLYEFKVLYFFVSYLTVQFEISVIRVRCSSLKCWYETIFTTNNNSSLVTCEWVNSESPWTSVTPTFKSAVIVEHQDVAKVSAGYKAFLVQSPHMTCDVSWNSRLALCNWDLILKPSIIDCVMHGCSWFEVVINFDILKFIRSCHNSYEILWKRCETALVIYQTEAFFS